VLQHAPYRVQQLPHYRNDDLHALFAGGDAFGVERFYVGLVLNGHESWHVKRRPKISVANLRNSPWPVDRAA
jgi:hypothetical protein